MLKLFSDSIGISDCLPHSSDGEKRPGFISVPDINNNTAMIINIKNGVLFCTTWIFVCASLCMNVPWLVGFAMFCRDKILYIKAGSPTDILPGGTRQDETSLQIEDLRSNKNV